MIFEVVKVTTTGDFTEYRLPTASLAESLTAGTDGNVWFTYRSQPKVASVSTSGVFAEFQIPLPYATVIAAGPDGSIWFATPTVDAIYKSVVVPT
jgi:virginiamycin B lyase